MMFYFQSGQLGHSTNTIILKSNEHKSYAWVFGVICTFQSSQFFERLSMHFGVVDHIRASALTTGILDISVPGHFGTDLDISVLGTGHFGTDLDISVLGTGQFGTWMRQYSLLTTIVWYLLIVNIFVLVVL